MATVDGDPRNSRPRSENKGDLVLNDFLGKRFGGGSKFYGERVSDMSEEELAARAAQYAPTGEELLAAQAERDLLPNAILVVGATGRTGKWVVLSLLNKGFNVRVLARNLAKARSMFYFGPRGVSVDFVIGDVSSQEDMAEAVDGCQAVIYCAGGARGPLGGSSLRQVDYEGVERCVHACEASGTVQKLVLMSAAGVSGPTADGLLNKLAGDPLGWKLRGEQAVRVGSIPYVIVRAGGLVDGATGPQTIEVGQGDLFWGGCSICRADAAEAIVESLVGEVDGVSFEVKNGGDDPLRQRSYLELGADRKAQLELEEQEASEAFWAEQFLGMEPDP